MLALVSTGFLGPNIKAIIVYITLKLKHCSYIDLISCYVSVLRDKCVFSCTLVMVTCNRWKLCVYLARQMTGFSGLIWCYCLKSSVFVCACMYLCACACTRVCVCVCVRIHLCASDFLTSLLPYQYLVIALCAWFGYTVHDFGTLCMILVMYVWLWWCQCCKFRRLLQTECW